MYTFEWRLHAERKLVKGMTDEEIFKFVSYFLKSINPDIYYNHLYATKPENIGMEFVIDSNYRVVTMRSYA